MTQETLLSIAEAAEYMGVAQKTIRRWIGRGALTAHRVGPRVIRIKQAELDAMLRQIPTTA